MKWIATLFCLFSGLMCLAQEPTAAEIKKRKIKKIIIVSLETEANVTHRLETYYDANGNDTAVYDDYGRQNYKKITYNSKSKPENLEEYNKDEQLKGTTVYSYKPDGSFTSIYTDSDFGMKNTYKYDKKGNLQEFSIPDGTVIKYVYNAKDQLTRSYSVPKNDGTKLERLYSYNAKGQLMSLVSKGDFPSTVKYEYFENGLLKKEVGSFVNSYEYGY